MRRAAHEGLNKLATTNARTIATDEALLLVEGLLADPKNWDLHFRR